MKFILNLVLIYCLIISQAFGQATNPNDVLKLGDKSSSSDKGITFETGDGVSNKKLLVEKISKKLKWNGNSVQIGDGSASSDKEIVIAGALKSLKYNGTSGEFEFNDDVKLIGSLKTDILQAINSEISVKNALRAELGVKFGTGNAEIKYDTGLNSLVFSNDGTLYKKVGSGSGGGDGGVSILKNGSFEDGSMNWTNSGGTYAVESYTNGTESDLKYAKFTATSASQTLCSDLANTPSYFGAGGMIDFTYTGTGTAFLAYVQDSLGNKLTSPQALLNQTAWTKLSPIPFSFNTSQKLCFESSSAGEIKIDKAYLGSNKNVNSVVYVKQGEVYAQGNAAQSITVNVTDIPFILSSDNEALVGRWNGTSFIAPFDADYDIKGAVYFGSILSRQVVAYVNGVSVKQLSASDYSGNAPQFVGRLRLLKDQVLTFRISANGGTLVNGPANHWLSISVSKAISDQVQTPEASQWFIDANIGGDNIDLGPSSDKTSYTQMTNANLDMVINTSKGSSNAKISCVNGVASTGLTCTGGAEDVGISFTPPYAGLYEVCASFSSYLYDGGTGQTVDQTFQLIETPNNSTTILQEGDSRTNLGSNGYYSAGHGGSFRNCGTFKFSTVSEKTVRLMYELYSSSVADSIYVYADRASTKGQRDIHITVRPLLQNSLRAILTGDQVTAKNAKNPKIVSYAFSGSTSSWSECAISTCAEYSKIGDGISQVNFLTTGQYNVIFDKTYSQANCTVSPTNVGSGYGVFLASPASRPSVKNTNTMPLYFWRGNDESYRNVAAVINCVLID